jgi:glycine cleavage system H protein
MDIDGCELPDDLLYDTENDLWVQPQPDGKTWTIGLTAWLASFAGRFVAVRFRPLDGTVSRGRSLGTVESHRYTGPVRIPADATVQARNEAIVQRPKLINDYSYTEGWFAQIVPVDPEASRALLRSALQAEEIVRRKIRELSIRCYPATPDTAMYEIGIECSAILAKLDDEVQRREPGEVILLVTDDPTSPIEMVRWSDRTGYPVIHHRREGPLHHFLIRRVPTPVPRPRGR